MKHSKLTLLVIPATALAIFAIGCTSKSAHEHTMPDGTKMEDSQMKGTAAVSDATPSTLPIFKDDKGQIVCPVQGDVIESEEKAFAHQDYKGTRYYFCCGGCPEEFAKDPEKYIKGA